MAEILIEIIVGGGAVQEVLYQEGAPVRVVVKDYDTEGIDSTETEVDDEGYASTRTEW